MNRRHLDPLEAQVFTLLILHHQHKALAHLLPASHRNKGPRRRKHLSKVSKWGSTGLSRPGPLGCDWKHGLGAQLCQLPLPPSHRSNHPLCTISINSHPWKKKKYLLLKTAKGTTAVSTLLLPFSTPVPQTVSKLIASPWWHFLTILHTFLQKTVQTHKRTSIALFPPS